jgi:hypothetical protein
LQTLKELVVKGIDPKLVSNAVKRHEFSVRELSGDMPTGIKAMNRAMRGWLQGLQPHETIRVRKPLDEVKQPSPPVVKSGKTCFRPEIRIIQPSDTSSNGSRTTCWTIRTVACSASCPMCSYGPARTGHREAP